MHLFIICKKIKIGLVPLIFMFISLFIDPKNYFFIIKNYSDIINSSITRQLSLINEFCKLKIMQGVENSHTMLNKLMLILKSIYVKVSSNFQGYNVH